MRSCHPTIRHPLSFIGLLSIFLSVYLFSSCNKEDENSPPPSAATGTVGLRFIHLVDSLPLQLDTFNYVTYGGVLYKVTDLQYFVSRITLYPHDREPVVLSGGDSIRYIDQRIPETHEWIPAGTIPAGNYDSVAFTFGLDAQQNISHRFPNPPERDMFWPEVLGGGYHHMKLNSVHKNCCTNLDTPFMMHIGTGQIYSSQTPNTDSIIGFVQNAFRVSLPGSSFTLENDSLLVLSIVMNIDRWFNGPPNMLDLNTMPQGIMQDQERMNMVCENGRNVFSVMNE